MCHWYHRKTLWIFNREVLLQKLIKQLFINLFCIRNDHKNLRDFLKTQYANYIITKISTEDRQYFSVAIQLPEQTQLDYVSDDADENDFFPPFVTAERSKDHQEVCIYCV